MLAAVGAYGLAIIAVTLLVRLVLAPLFQLQLSLGRRSMENQRRLAPELTEIRKKYRNDPQTLQAATLQLYRENGINPLAGLHASLPPLLPFPTPTTPS